LNLRVSLTITKNQSTNTVSHEYYLVNSRDRYQALKRLADGYPDIFSVIFCRTKRDTQKVAENLIEDGYNAAALHGDLSQNQRDLVMKSFRNRQIQMLVATDVAARGIDVDDITHVINYQLPDEIETYTHRSGRTGRAGKQGVSMVIVSKSEVRKIRSVERIINQKFEHKQVPTAEKICETQLFHLASKIKDTEVNHDIDPYLPAIHEVLEGLDREELIKKLVSVEFTRFINYYKKSKDLNESVQADAREASGDSTRFFINIGSKDGYDWMVLKDFLKEKLELDKDAVYKVDVKDSFSFFNTDTTEKDKVLAFFTDFQIEGRFINVEVSASRGGGGGRSRDRRSGGGGGGGRRFKGSRDGGSGGGDWKKKRSEGESSRPRRSDSDSSRPRRSGGSGGSSASSEGKFKGRSRRRSS
jgi:ATP-dependent RNA helicase DeaD